MSWNTISLSLGDALYGSVNVHSLREKDRWCEIAATMIREKQFAKPPGNQLPGNNNITFINPISMYMSVPIGVLLVVICFLE